MNTTEQINALVEKYGLSETVKQEIVKIVNDAYIQGHNDCHKQLKECYKQLKEFGKLKE